jgi:WD40 repeat protein
MKVPDEGIYAAVIAVAIQSRRSVDCGRFERPDRARIWDASSGELRATCSGHGGFVNEVLFSHDGQQLITAGVDATIRTWDAATGAPLQSLRGHTREIPAIKCLPNAPQLVSAGRDGTFRLWNLDATYGSRQALYIQPAGTYTTTFSPDGETLYCAMFNGHVSVLDSSSAKIVADWQAHAGASCNSLAISADGSRLLTCSWDKTAKLWATSDHSLLATLGRGRRRYGCDLGGRAIDCLVREK